MNLKKYTYSIYDEVDKCQWLDVRARETSREDPIPNTLAINLYSENELKKIRTKGFSNEIGKKIMHGIYDLESKLSPNKKIILFDQGKGIIAQAIWQHFQPTHSIFIFKGGIRSMLLEAEKALRHDFRFIVLHGKTGTGKTEILDELSKMDQQVLNLEKLARHKGSSFGNLEENLQPSQHSFVIELAMALSGFDPGKVVYTEFEKHSLGKNIIPLAIAEALEFGKAVHIKQRKDLRLKRLIDQYAEINDENLLKGIKTLEFRLKTGETERLKKELNAKAYKNVAEGLLNYFDESETYKLLDEKEYSLVISDEEVEVSAEKLIKVFT